MFKVLHIHTDNKFLSYNKAFSDPSFSNTIMFIYEKKNDTHSLYSKHDIILIENSQKGLKSAIDIANNADLIVVYMMDITKSYIVNRIRTGIPIVWRFYGAELYGKLNNYVLSDLTKQIIQKQNYPFVIRIRAFLNNILTYGINYKAEFDCSIKRVDAIAMLYKQEYVFLSDFFMLPKFIQLSYNSNRSVNLLLSKTNTIIIGNSRNRYNNHLEIIRLIKEGGHEKFSYEMPFNYGETSLYSNMVLREAELLPNCHVIKEFMPKNEYCQLFSDAAAFVFNAHRQMAMGNIFIAIENNTKVYLNPKNSAYQWLLEEGFAVFSIEDLVDDMNNNNIYISTNESNRNLTALNSLSKKYNIDSLVQEIHLLIMNKLKNKQYE